jgi:hypothetical protein
MLASLRGRARLSLRLANKAIITADRDFQTTTQLRPMARWLQPWQPPWASFQDHCACYGSRLHSQLVLRSHSPAETQGYFVLRESSEQGFDNPQSDHCHSGNLARAVALYDKTSRPFVKQIQGVNPSPLRLGAPRTRFGISVFLSVTGLAALLRIPERVATVLGGGARPFARIPGAAFVSDSCCS